MDANEISNSQPDSPIGEDRRSILTWLVTGLIFYGLISGLIITLMPFGHVVQYTVLVHSVVGVLAFAPMTWAVARHWKRRRFSIGEREYTAAFGASLAAAACLASGLALSLQAGFATRVPAWWSQAHLVTALILVILMLRHLLPILRRYRAGAATQRRVARSRFVVASAAMTALLLGSAGVFALLTQEEDSYQPFSNEYDWQYGEDRPFWPSRAALHNPPWQVAFLEAVRNTLTLAQQAAFQGAIADVGDARGGFISRAAAALEGLGLDAGEYDQLRLALAQAADSLQAHGAIVPGAMTGAASCGASGCHATIYEEWLPSAHGFSATDVLYLRVQQLLAETNDLAHTRACAGCHDPAALLSGARSDRHRDDKPIAIYEGNSCIVCHSIVSTDSVGNGGYVLQVPERYLFEGAQSLIGRLAGHFLLRSYPDHHVATYKRPLYKDSAFCAACHKQTPMPGVQTTAGLAQEQNEYDSWRLGKWYHEDDENRTIECRECHMPLVASDDPASGDQYDSYRHPDDGRHRSHRTLASNMYIPVVQDLPGAERQAAATIAWLRGEIEIPEIEYKWTTGPVVQIDIEAPDRIKPGQLVSLKLHLVNRKTGHDFPAGPLDVLESWVELKVEDDLGNELLLLGEEHSVNPALRAPVVYKADWYDRQGLPVERHNLWDVVGASYKRTIGSDGQDVVDVSFRCPGIARPRLSESVAEAGPGERNADVVFSLGDTEFGELKVTARLLFRKANPNFLARVFGFEPFIDAPVVEMASATHRITVSAD